LCRQRIVCATYNLATTVAEKSRLLLFLSKNLFLIYFLSKTPMNHPIYLLELIHGHQKTAQNRNPSKKIYSQALIYFYWCFQGKQTPNHNIPHRMKPFDG